MLLQIQIGDANDAVGDSIDAAVCENHEDEQFRLMILGKLQRMTSFIYEAKT